MKKHLTIITLALLMPLALAQSTRILFDGRLNLKSAAPSTSEMQLLRREVLPAAARQWSKDCITPEFEVIDVTSGSFTRKGAKERVVLYRYCFVARQFTHMGIAIIERGRITHHWGYEGGMELAIGRLPDINQNGYNELIVDGSGSGTGETRSSVTILEFVRGQAKDYGSLEYYQDICGMRSDSIATTKRLFFKASSKPRFYAETYSSRCETNKPLVKTGNRQEVKLNTEYAIQFIRLK
jgi:hypothetical protein